MSLAPHKQLNLLSIVIPARAAEAYIASTVEHLQLELTLLHVPHEILVVDDGSSDRTWPILQDLALKTQALRPVQNLGLHGFGRAIAGRVEKNPARGCWNFFQSGAVGGHRRAATGNEADPTAPETGS